MPENTPDYFRRRAREEREHAKAATDSCARQAHERIAIEYERVAGEVIEPQLRAVMR
jgi:hypothetical protein